MHKSEMPILIKFFVDRVFFEDFPLLAKCTIFSYLDFMTVFKKVQKINKNARKLLLESEIARENKKLILYLNKDTYGRCLMHGQ